MKNLFKIKCICQFVFILLFSLESSQAMECKDGLLDSENGPRKVLQTEEVKQELTLSFDSRRTGKDYKVIAQEGASLNDYIRILKRQSVIDKDEGIYNYGGQNFFIGARCYNGTQILTYLEIEELSRNAQKITFLFKER
ncbi:MAG: hypothetical protein K2W94_05875 [Alphaproteobacteria bacterium]|nr:hypothetical protein [Alphaproteobacteria bacterium]